MFLYISEALAPRYDSEVTKILARQTFGLMVDESNDTDSKCLVILARVYLPNEKAARTLFIDLAPCPLSTSQGIFDTIDAVFR